MATRITKEEVLEALTYPHLAPGMFVHSNSDISKKQFEKVDGLKMCAAAACLAVRLRGKGTVGELINYCFDNIGDVNYRGTSRENPLSPYRDKEIKRMKAANRWLDLLACEYEYLCEKYPDNRPYAKGEMVKFVKAQFPPYFDFDPVPFTTAEERNSYGK